jgi:LysR family transcriptional regulator, low CO2-responsive transcriptional regulator
MNYTLHQLQVFLKVTQIQSVTKAAEHLHLSQPAVSIQLKKFQDQFDIPLTEVVGRKLFVTDFGRDIAQVCERILNEADAIKYKTLEHKGHLTGQLKLSIVSTAKYVMPYFLSGYLKKYEGIDLSMDVTNRSKVIKAMEANTVDFALVSVLPENLDFERLELMENKLQLVSGNDFKFNESNHSPEILQDYPIIYREQGSATRQAMEQYISDHDLKVRKKIVLTSNEAVKQAVIAGLGLSIMPIIGIKKELQDGEIRLLEIDGLPVHTNWNLIWLKNKHFSPAAKAFLEYLNHERDTIIDSQFSWIKNY